MAILALSLGGCGSPSDSQDESLGAAALRDLSRLEASALADKLITQAELEKAGQAYSECLESNGFEVEFSGSPQGPDEAVATFRSTAGDDIAKAQVEEERFDAAYDACRSDVNAVAAVWALQNQLSAEEVQQAGLTLATCLVSAGVDLSPTATPEESFKEANEFREAKPVEDSSRLKAESCLEAFSVAAELALPGLAEALAELDVSAGG